MIGDSNRGSEPNPVAVQVSVSKPEQVSPLTQEVDGRADLDPTRYGDWEKKGRCIDF